MTLKKTHKGGNTESPTSYRNCTLWLCRRESNWLTFFLSWRQASPQPQNVAFKDPTAVTSDPMLQSPRPGRWQREPRTLLLHIEFWQGQQGFCFFLFFCCCCFFESSLCGARQRDIRWRWSRRKTTGANARFFFFLSPSNSFESWCLNRSLCFSRAAVLTLCSSLKALMTNSFSLVLKLSTKNTGRAHPPTCPLALLKRPKHPWKRGTL